MTALCQDIKYSLRMLRKSPGFTAIALITLAIGIGANTIMFSMVNVMLLLPVQVKEPDRLVSCETRNALFSYEIYRDVRDDIPPFSNVTAFGRDLQGVRLVQGNSARQATCTFVAANYFSFLGVRPARGRDFLPTEEQRGAEPVAVLSHRFWQRQGGDPNILGSQIVINGTSFRVVGIAPKGFTGIALTGPDFWLPLIAYGLIGHEGREQRPGRTDIYNYPPLSLVGRLKPGLNMAAAEAQLQTLLTRLRERFPRFWREGAALNLRRLSRVIANGPDDRTMLYIFSAFLMAVSVIVLLIACLNLGNMIVVQGAARHREIAIRMAIGGGRLRIIRQLLCESLLLALIGGALGCVLAFWGTKIISVWLVAPQVPELAGMPRIGLDLRVLGGTLGFCLIATVLFGLNPALRLSKRDVIAEIKESGNEAARSQRKRWCFVPRGLSVVGQIALSVVLVMGAVLFTRSALYAGGVDPSFSLDHKILIEIDPLAAGYDRTRSIQVYQSLTDHLRSVPGVQAAAFSNSFPLCGGGDMGNAIVEYTPGTEIDEDRELPMGKRPMYVEYRVGEDFFESMGIPLLQGRAFNRLDGAADAEKVVIIDERMARKLRPNGSALGCFIQFGFFSLSSPYRVIGIVPDVRSNVQDQQTFPQIYVPLEPDRLPKYIHLRVADTESAAALLGRITAEIHKADSRLPVVSVMTLAQKYRTSPSVWAAGLGARLAITFGAMALFLASLGIYAVKGYMVASRTPEIGIRKALGATHGNIMAMVFREGTVLTVAGLLVGLLLGLGIARLIHSLFYGVSPIDPVSIVATIVLLGAASLFASYIPVRRAAKIDPMEALRCE
jgi:macrolide transport system ATP-binding/permease protein